MRLPAHREKAASFYLLNKFHLFSGCQTVYYKKVNNYTDYTLTNNGVRDRIIKKNLN